MDSSPNDENLSGTVFLERNLRLLSCLGIWKTVKFGFSPVNYLLPITKILVPIIMFFVMIAAFFGCLNSLNNLMILGQALYFLLVISVLLVQFLYMFYNRPAFEHLIETFEDTFQACAKLARGETFNVTLEPWLRRARQLTNVWFFIWLYIGIHWCFFPITNMIMQNLSETDENINITTTSNTKSDGDDLLEKDNYFLFNGWYYWEKNESPYFYLVYISECLVAVFMVWEIGSVDTFIYSFLLLTCAQFQQLIQCFQQINTEQTILTTNNPSKQLHQCIQAHRKLLNMYKEFNDVFSMVNFFHCWKTLVALCLLTFDFTMIKAGDSKVVNLVEFISIYIIEFFLFTWYSDEITKLSGDVSIAVYESHWTEKSKRFKQSITFVIQRAQQTLILQGGSFFIMNLELFLGLLRLSFSIFTLLRNMNDSNKLENKD